MTNPGHLDGDDLDDDDDGDDGDDDDDYSDGDDYSDDDKDCDDCIQHVNIAMANPRHLEHSPLVRKIE